MSPLHLSPNALRSIALDLADAAAPGLYALGGTHRTPTSRHVMALRTPDDLIGVAAEASWRGVAVVLPGASMVIDAPWPERDRITLCLALDRRGVTEVGLRASDGTVQALPSPQDSSGFVVDVARRVLGLPTEGTTPGPEMLVLASWLEAMLDVVADPDTASTVTSWADAVSLHPLVSGTPDRHASPDRLADVMLLAADRFGWARMYDSMVAQAIAPAGLTPEQLAWMDWPFFARWTLSVHRPVTELLDDLCLFVDGPLLLDVQYTVAAVGWLGFVDHGAPDSTGDE